MDDLLLRGSAHKVGTDNSFGRSDHGNKPMGASPQRPRLTQQHRRQRGLAIKDKQQLSYFMLSANKHVRLATQVTIKEKQESPFRVISGVFITAGHNKSDMSEIFDP